MSVSLPVVDRFWLQNASVPLSLLPQPPSGIQQTWEGLALVNLEIVAGTIGQIVPATTAIAPNVPIVDLASKQVWPCFVDLHTHLDKAHTWPRTPNPDGQFRSALHVLELDARQHWRTDDLYRRMEFGLKCSYAHGSRAIRTHLDMVEGLIEVSLAVFQSLRQKWADRLTLQAVSLVGLDYFMSPAGEVLADQLAEAGAILGGVAWANPELPQQLDRVMTLARERGLQLDFHVDESNQPDDQALRYVAEAVLRHNWTDPIVCGHACSLAVQPEATVKETLQLVKAAGIGIVSLPLCNLYLQDRQRDRTPRWRGVTLVHELRQQGTPVALAHDNCRDAFHGFGDHDMLEVWSLSAKIAHLDQPYGQWPQAVTSIPADLMGLPQVGRIAIGLPADLVIFNARNFSELLARPQVDRVVVRRGQAIDTTLPDYAELDDLVGY